MSALAIALALLAALLFALGTVLQQKGAMQETDEAARRAGFLFKLTRKPVWLLGVVIDVSGYLAQAAALGVGKLVVVQPLLVTSLVLALPLGVKLTGQQVGRREILGAVMVCAGLAVFMLVVDPREGKTDAAARDWIISAAVVAGVAVALVIAGFRTRKGVKAALIGTAAGVILGFVAPLTKATVTRFDDGIVPVVADWHLWALLAANLVGFALVQISLQTGALAPSLSSTMVFETLVGVLMGITILDENLHENHLELGITAASLACVLGGVVVLATSKHETQVAVPALGGTSSA
jgi:drug/metabolite transporter (DMT)-like permease